MLKNGHKKWSTKPNIPIISINVSSIVASICSSASLNRKVSHLTLCFTTPKYGWTSYILASNPYTVIPPWPVNPIVCIVSLKYFQCFIIFLLIMFPSGENDQSSWLTSGRKKKKVNCICFPNRIAWSCTCSAVAAVFGNASYSFSLS